MLCGPHNVAKVFNRKSIVAKLCLNFMFDARFFHHLEAGLSRSPVEAPITFAQSRACILDSICPGKMKKILPPPQDEDKTRQNEDNSEKKLPLHLPTNPPSELFLSSRLTLGRSWSALPLLYSKASKASSSASSTWPVVLCSDAHAVGDVPWSTLHSLGNPQLFSCLQHPGLIKYLFGSETKRLRKKVTNTLFE